MSKTNIEWTDRTWNFLRGCSRVSKGCENCYAEADALRFSGPGLAYEGLVKRSSKKGLPQWTGQVRFVRKKLFDPLGWKRCRVFVNSMSDLFHEEVPFAQIAAALGVMARCPDVTFQALTKRVDRALAFYDWIENHPTTNPLNIAYMHARDQVRTDSEHRRWQRAHGRSMGVWPLPNLQVGASVEDQATLEERAPKLRRVPAWVRWLSYEPALGPVDLRPYLPPVALTLPAKPSTVPDAALREFAHMRRMMRVGAGGGPNTGAIEWVVVGGESGPRARPFDVAWAERAVEACARSVVPVFVKQLGSKPRRLAGAAGPELDCGCREAFCEHVKPERFEVIELRSKKGGKPDEWPDDLKHLRVRQQPQLPRAAIEQVEIRRHRHRHVGASTR